MTVRLPKEYLGHILWPCGHNSAGMRWHSLGIGRADTLAGMKRMVALHVRGPHPAPKSQRRTR